MLLTTKHAMIPVLAINRHRGTYLYLLYALPPPILNAAYSLL